jgi:hypothetical protein
MLVFKDPRLGAGPCNDTRPLAAITVRLIIGLLLTTGKRKTNHQSSTVASGVGIPYKEVWYRERNKGIWSVVEVLQKKFYRFRGTNLRRVFTGVQSASISPPRTPRTFLLRSGEMGVVYIARS